MGRATARPWEDPRVRTRARGSEVDSNLSFTWFSRDPGFVTFAFSLIWPFFALTGRSLRTNESSCFSMDSSTEVHIVESKLTSLATSLAVTSLAVLSPRSISHSAMADSTGSPSRDDFRAWQPPSVTPARTVYSGDDGVSLISMDVEKDVDSRVSALLVSSQDHGRDAVESVFVVAPVEEGDLELPHMGHEKDDCVMQNGGDWYHVWALVGGGGEPSAVSVVVSCRLSCQ